PDGDSWWVSTGASYKVNDRVWLDGAIGATFTESVDVDVSASQPGNAFRGDFSGRATDAGAVFGAFQIRIAF
ncbi:MAG: hypothetical protein V2I76_13795, partial [Roseobacter sp.]|nr:hypothetical protein [Roseobacter sp.]